MKHLLCLLVSILFCTCSFREWGKDLGSGFAGGVQEKSDSVGGRLMRGARDTLLSSETERRLTRLIDSLGRTLEHKAVAARDSLLGRDTRELLGRLRNIVIGDSAKRQLAALREEMLGSRTRRLIGGLREELLGDSARAKVGKLGQEFFGGATRASIDSIVASAVKTLALQYEKEISPLIKRERTWLQRNVVEILVIAGLIIAGLIAFANYMRVQRRRYRKMIGVVAQQIETMEDKTSHDSLKNKISEKALQEGIESQLRTVLKAEGIVKGKV